VLLSLSLLLSELMLLKKLEEVLDFEAAVFGHVCAVNCVTHSIQAELSSDGVGSQVSGNFWVMWAA
jgi:hypothetical protein